MLTIIVLVLVGLLPFLFGFGVLLWGVLFKGHSEAAGLAKSVAIGLIAGALGGALIGLTLVGLVLALVHFRGA